MTAFLVNIDDAFFMRVAAGVHRCMGGIAAIASQRIDALNGLEGAEFIDTRHLYRHADVARLLSQMPPGSPLSETTLRDLVECEHYFLTITDRTQSTPRSVTSRRRLFRDLVRYWTAFLERRLHIRTVWFESTPHMGWDLVLFYVARILGRRTSILARTLLEDRVYFHDDFRTELDIELPDGDEATLERMAGPELTQLIGRSSTWLEKSQAFNAQALMQEPLAQQLRIRARTALKIMQSLIKPAGFFSATAGDEPLSAFAIRTREVMFRRELKALRRSYDSLARPVSLDRPFIYFSLHYQPERTSQPEALMFDDQLVAIDLIARALPLGWRVLVKEHPRQLGRYPAVLRRRHARQPLDYQQIASLPNVEIVPIEVPSSALIAASRLTATLTGTAGWEGLLSGKPALLFGPAWYSRCRSVAIIGTVQDVADAIDRAARSSPDTVRRDVLALLAALRPRLFRSSTSHKFALGSRSSYDELVETMVEVLAAELNGSSTSRLQTTTTNSR